MQARLCLLYAGLVHSFATIAKGNLNTLQQKLLQPPVNAETIEQVSHTCSMVQDTAKMLTSAVKVMQAHESDEVLMQCVRLMHEGIVYMLKSGQELHVHPYLMHSLRQMLSDTRGVQLILLLAHQLQQDVQTTAAMLQHVSVSVPAL